MLGSVVRRKTLPQPTASLFSKSFHQNFAGVGTQVVHDQMDGIGLPIASGDIQQVIGKLSRAASRSHLGEVPSRLGLDPANHVGGSATLVFIVSPGNSSWLHRDRGTGVGMQHYRLLVDADHWCPLAHRLFIQPQQLLHAGDVLLVQLRHAPHFFPATASGRGFPAAPGWFLALPVVPTCAGSPLRSAGAPSSVPVLTAAGCRPPQ